MSLEWYNLRRILGNLDSDDFTALVDALLAAAILSFNDGNLILQEYTRDAQLRAVLAHLESCPPADFKFFIGLLLKKAETFVLGSEIGCKYIECSQCAEQEGGIMLCLFQYCRDEISN